jgi:hypothetical protein
MQASGLAHSQRLQRGVTLIGLLFWAIVIGFVAVVGLKTFPSVNEYLTIRRAINKIADSGATTVAEVRSAFDKQKEIEYAISSISGKDLKITKEDERVVIAFAYDKEIEIYGPVYLMIKYEGRSR